MIQYKLAICREHKKIWMASCLTDGRLYYHENELYDKKLLVGIAIYRFSKHRHFQSKFGEEKRQDTFLARIAWANIEREENSCQEGIPRNTVWFEYRVHRRDHKNDGLGAAA